MRIVQCFLILLVLTTCTLSARELEDVVYLKNGRVIRGTIIEHVPGKSFKIQTSDRNIFVFTYEEIDRMTRENVIQSNSGQEAFEQKAFKYANMTRIGFLTGVGEPIFSWSNLNEFWFDNNLGIGLGVGFDRYPNDTMMPLFVDLRLMAAGVVRPYVLAGVGYSVHQSGRSSSESGGLMLHIGIGIALPVDEDKSLIAEVGYKHQSGKIAVDKYTYREAYDFFSFQIGVSL
jgi:hypothetical protein